VGVEYNMILFNGIDCREIPLDVVSTMTCNRERNPGLLGEKCESNLMSGVAIEDLGCW
jgi:hypothetical protein